MTTSYNVDCKKSNSRIELCLLKGQEADICEECSALIKQLDADHCR